MHKNLKKKRSKLELAAQKVKERLMIVGSPASLERFEIILSAELELAERINEEPRLAERMAALKEAKTKAERRVVALSHAAVIIANEELDRTVVDLAAIDQFDAMTMAKSVLARIDGISGVISLVGALLEQARDACGAATAEYEATHEAAEQLNLVVRSSIINFESLVISGEALLALSDVTVPRRAPAKKKPTDDELAALDRADVPVATSVTEKTTH